MSKLITDFVHEEFLVKIPKIEENLKNNNIKYKVFKANKNWQKDVSRYIDKNGYKIILLGQTGVLGKPFNLERDDRIFLNCHPGKLPEYRGIDSFKWAIFENQFDSFKSTIHIVRPKIDAGEIVSFENYNIKKISWVFGDRQLLIITAKHLANFIHCTLINQTTIEKILKNSKKQPTKKIRFKMGIIKEMKSLIIFFLKLK